MEQTGNICRYIYPTHHIHTAGTIPNKNKWQKDKRWRFLGIRKGLNLGLKAEK